MTRFVAISALIVIGYLAAVGIANYLWFRKYVERAELYAKRMEEAGPKAWSGIYTSPPNHGWTEPPVSPYYGKRPPR